MANKKPCPPPADKRAPKRQIPSRKKAIEDMCKQCSYDEGGLGSGTWRRQTLECLGTKCPLYPLRPVPAGIVLNPDGSWDETQEVME